MVVRSLDVGMVWSIEKRVDMTTWVVNQASVLTVSSSLFSKSRRNRINNDAFLDLSTTHLMDVVPKFFLLLFSCGK